MDASSRAIHGYCVKCRARCGVIAEVQDNRLTRIRSDESHPNGGICAMGAAAPEFAARGDRLLYPLRRTAPKGERDPRWRRITWDQALDKVTERLKLVTQRHGPEAIGFSRPTPQANASSDWYPYLLRLANLIGTPNVHTTGYLCQWNRDDGLRYTYGVGLPSPMFEDASLVLIFGHNAAVTNPQTFHRLRDARKRGTAVVLVDPRECETARFSDLWLQPHYGTDGALIMGAIREMLRTGLYDVDFTKRWTNAPLLVHPQTGQLLQYLDPTGGRRHYCVSDSQGRVWPVDVQAHPRSWPCDPELFRELESAAPTGPGSTSASGAKTVLSCIRDEVEAFTIERVADETGLTGPNIKAFYDLVLHRRPLCYYTWNGWEQHTNSFYTHRAMGVLYGLTGCLDSPGGNVVLPSLELPDLGGASFLPTGQVEKRLGMETNPLGAPTSSSAAYFFYRSIIEGEPYRLRTLLSFGSNMLLQNPDSDRGRAALAQLDFHVHVDMLMTPMAEHADLLLPAATQWESPGLRLGFDGDIETALHVQYRPVAAPPPGEARPDIEVIFDLACRLGFQDDFWGGDVHASFEARLAPLGVSLENLFREPAGVSVSRALRYQKYAEPDGNHGAVRGFNTRTRKLELYSELLLQGGHEALPVYRRPEGNPSARPPIDKQWPLVLSSIKLRVMVQSQHRGVGSLRRRWPRPFVEMHPETAKEWNVKDGELIRIVSPDGEMRATCVVTTRVLPGSVVGQAGWWEACEPLQLPGYNPFSPEGANYNRLISSRSVDEVSGGVSAKSYPCRIEKVAG